jgi:hypothetical protein
VSDILKVKEIEILCIRVAFTKWKFNGETEMVKVAKRKVVRHCNVDINCKEQLQA